MPDKGEVLQVKQWFEQRKETWIPEKSSGENHKEDSGELRMPFFEKDPDWSKFHSYYFEDGRKVYEIPLKNAEVFLPSDVMNSLNVEENGKSIIQNILFVESPSANGTFYMPLIARYYPSAEVDVKDFQEIYYNKIPVDWSGTLDIWTYDERFFVGFVIEDGQITTTRHPDIASSIENSSKKDPSINHLVSCQRYRITIVIYNIVCAGANNCHVTQGETEYRYVTECTVSSGAGPSLGGIDSIYNYPGSGGGGATGTIGSSDDIEVKVPPLPPARVVIQLDDSFRQNRREVCLLNKLRDNGYFEAMASKFEGVSPGIELKLFLTSLGNPSINGQAQWRGKGRPMHITINEQNFHTRSSLEVARTILHEMLHADFYRALNTSDPDGQDMQFRDTFDSYVKMYMGTGDQHHNLMANEYLDVMADILADIHKSLDYAEFSEFMKDVYPNGIPKSFYKSLAWEGLDGTIAFQLMKNMKLPPPLKSEYDKYKLNKDFIRNYGTKNCK